MIAAATLQDLTSSARSIQDWIVTRRRFLHQNPELSFREEKTAAYVERELKWLGYTTIHTRVNGNYGICAELIGRDRERCIGLRADMDALPIHEEYPSEFQSRTAGVSHMCGHDAHTAMLLGAARLLKEREAELPCTVRLFFQGAEEKSPGGANDFIVTGMLDGVDAMYGLHVDPRHDTGMVHFTEGLALAGVNEFSIRVIGRGGHAAFPHTTIDPIPVAAQIVLALQTVVSRTVDPFDQAVLSVTQLHGGEANNVVPEEVRIDGTFRSFRRDMEAHYGGAIARIAENVAAASNCRAKVQIVPGYPPLFNDPEATERMRAVAREIFPDGVMDGSPIMASEDFALYTRVVPACFAFLGASAPADSERYMLHHAKFHLDEDALPRGTALLAGMALAAE